MSINDELNMIIDHYLGVTGIGKPAHYAHKRSCLDLSENPPNKFSAKDLVTEMLSCMELNLQTSLHNGSFQPSPKNWRWEKQPHIAKHNPSLEKTLEKEIVNVTSEDWVNQVPTASGLFGRFSNRQRNIDLIHRIKSNEYEFIELKVKSDNPLKGAMEILQYAVFYIFSLLHYSDEMKKVKELLQAEIIHLIFLAL